MLEIIKRERINVVMPTDENIVKALSEQRGQFPIELLLPRQDTIDLCQDKHALNLISSSPRHTGAADLQCQFTEGS